MAKVKIPSGGVGFLGLLTLVFIVLRLTGYIEWSWWWVLAPMWIPAALLVSFLLLIAWAKSSTRR